MARQAKAIIDLNAFRHNFLLAQTLAGEGWVVAVIKANGYGHGAVSLARSIPEAEMFAVASIEEAIELRLAGIDTPLLLLCGFFTGDELDDIAQFNLSLVIHNSQQLDTLLASGLPSPIDAWLKLDSGMHRLGFGTGEFMAAYRRLHSSPAVGRVTLMSHFSCADEPDNAANQAQLSAIDKHFSAIQAPVSLNNSAALVSRLGPQRQWHRPGIMLYGCNPFPIAHPIRQQLRPVMTLKSRLIGIRELSPGEAVGYSQTWTATQPARIGTVAIGYADGYPRHAPNGTPVLVNGQRTRLAGRVSMDLITVDLSDTPGARLGDSVELWGENLPVEEVAQLAGTISYELLTGISARVRREYLLP